MSLPIYRSLLLKQPGKRLYEHGGSHLHGYPSNLKRTKFEASPQFLRNSCPLSSPRVGHTIGLERVALVPLNSLVTPKDSACKCNKPVESSCKSDPRDPLMTLKNVTKGRVRENCTVGRQSEDLNSQQDWPKPAPFSMMYPPPKIREGVCVARDFPSGCGNSVLVDFSPRCGEANSVSPSRDKEVAGEKSDLEQRPLVDAVQKCEEKLECGDVLGARMGTKSENCISEKPSEDGECVCITQLWRKRTSVHEATEVTCWYNDLKSGFKGANGFDSSLLDKINLMEQNSSEDKSFCVAKKSMNPVFRDCQNYFLITESNQTSSVPSQLDLNRVKIGKALNLFDDIYEKLLQQLEARSKSERKQAAQIPVQAAMIAKQKLSWVNTNERVLGAVPGIKVGDQFRFRAQLALIGLHCQYMSGIDYMKKDGKIFATSIVDSGRYTHKKSSHQYTSELESPDVFTYSGQGGNPQIASGTCAKEPEDQKLKGGNLALKNSMEARFPVRVFRKLKMSRAFTTSAKRGKIPTFLYDGLYVVTHCTQERGPHGKLIFKFQFSRITGQPELTKHFVGSLTKLEEHDDCHVVDDNISQGKEKIPLRVVNHLDNEKPLRFKYVTEWFV